MVSEATVAFGTVMVFCAKGAAAANREAPKQKDAFVAVRRREDGRDISVKAFYGAGGEKKSGCGSERTANLGHPTPEAI